MWRLWLDNPLSMKIKKLTTKQVLKLREYPPTERWIEGVDLMGYWEAGDSLIFSQGDTKICISKWFLKEIL